MAAGFGWRLEPLAAMLWRWSASACVSGDQGPEHAVIGAPAKTAAWLVVSPLVMSSAPPAVEGGDLAYGLGDGREVLF
jgi:hypothetical protein